MKIQVIGERVILSSDTIAEAHKLFNIYLGKDEVKNEVTRKPHKKHNFIKQCDICGKGFKGLQGLGIHRVTHKRNQVSFKLPVQSI